MFASLICEAVVQQV